MLLLYSVLQTDQYQSKYGQVYVLRNMVLLPQAWFKGYNTDNTANLTDLEHVYNFTVADYNGESDKDLTILLETVYEPYNETKGETAVSVKYLSRYYFALQPAPQFRLTFETYVNSIANRKPTDVYLAVLQLYYIVQEQTITIADLNKDSSENGLFFDLDFDRVSATFKMQEFDFIQLNKTGNTNRSLSETIPVMTCDLADKYYYPYNGTFIFDSWAEKNNYSPYMHKNGSWTFKPRTPIDPEIRKRVNSGALQWNRCQLYLCKNVAATAGNNFTQCAQDNTPTFGIPVDYKLPDEGVDTSIMVGFSLMCVIFALLFMTFIYLSIRTQRARARRVTDKSKNKVQAKEGGGKAGHKEEKK